MLQLIAGPYNTTCILGNRTDSPSRAWRDIQEIPPLTDNDVWYRAFPIRGGTMLVQEGTFKVIRPVIEADITEACCGHGFNPASELIRNLWAQHGPKGILVEDGEIKLTDLQETIFHTLMEDLQQRINMPRSGEVSLEELRGIEKLIRRRFADIIKAG